MIFIASDHAGFKLKERIKTFLLKNNLEVTDLGTDSIQSVDFPIYCKRLVTKVAADKQSRGILICGTGIGMSICANRNPKIRAALCKDK